MTKPENVVDLAGNSLTMHDLVDITRQMRRNWRDPRAVAIAGAHAKAAIDRQLALHTYDIAPDLRRCSVVEIRYSPDVPDDAMVFVPLAADVAASADDYMIINIGGY
jgi:hypothetical protein